MNDLETINRGQVELWRIGGWLLFTQSLAPKRLKFFLMNPDGVYRVRHKEKVVYEGTDLDRAVEVYNAI